MDCVQHCRYYLQGTTLEVYEEATDAVMEGEDRMEMTHHLRHASVQRATDNTGGKWQQTVEDATDRQHWRQVAADSRGCSR